MISKPTRQLLPFAIIVLLGYIGFSLPLPVLPEMFLDPERSILPASFSIQDKTIFLGLVIAAYPIGQLFGCPILGQCSDRWGRKKIILISLCGNVIGYIITALGATAHSILGLFSGLLVCGFSEGNVALAQAVISDITTGKDKAKHFGWLNFFACLGFVIGPLIGGFLADPSHSSFFTFATPFWLAAIITLFAIGVVYFGSEEIPRKMKPKIGFFEVFGLIWKNLELRRFFIANFFVYLGMYAFWRFLPVYLERRFNFTSSGLAYAIAYESVAYALALIWLIKPIANRFSSRKIVATFSIFLSIMLIVVVLPSSPYSLIWTIPLVGGCLAIVMTNFSVMVSNAARLDVQGQTMGSLQSVQVCAEVVTALGGGFIAATNPSFPLYIGGAMALISACILMRRQKSSFE